MRIVHPSHGLTVSLRAPDRLAVTARGPPGAHLHVHHQGYCPSTHQWRTIGHITPPVRMPAGAMGKTHTMRLPPPPRGYPKLRVAVILTHGVQLAAAFTPLPAPSMVPNPSGIDLLAKACAGIAPDSFDPHQQDHAASTPPNICFSDFPTKVHTNVPLDLRIHVLGIPPQSVASTRVSLALLAGRKRLDLTQRGLNHPHGLDFPITHDRITGECACIVTGLTVLVPSAKHGNAFRLAARAEIAGVLVSCTSTPFSATPASLHPPAVLTPDMPVHFLTNIGPAYATTLANALGVETIGDLARMAPDWATPAASRLRRRGGFMTTEKLREAILEAAQIVRTCSN